MSKIYENENSIAFREFDEHCLDTLVEADIDVGFVCGACNRRNCVRAYSYQGKEGEALDCKWLMIVDGKHWLPICDECFASFGTPTSTAAKLFRL